jgi:fibronectin type 3 domain-containing protein
VVETATIAKVAHKAGSWETTKKATCTATGTKVKKCTVCKAVVETATIAKVAHKAGSWETTKKATVNKAGTKVKKCTVCKEVVETAKIAQLKCSKPKLSKIENTADGVKITWGKVSGADKYYEYRKTSGSYKKIATTTKAYYTDKDAKSGKKYYYVVKAVNEAGSSSASSSKSILYLADTTLSTPKSTKSGITLKWKKVTGAEGYQVWRTTGSGSYSKIATVKGNSKVTYTDKKAKKGKKYTYKVKAYKSKTYCAYSNTKTITDKY